MAEFSRRETESNEEPQIMTFEEYAEKEHDTPYVFTIESGNKKLVYFGAQHSNKPDDPMFQKIKEEFIAANPEIVFVEGVDNLDARKQHIIERAKILDEKDVIKRGEPAFTIKLAVEAEIDFDSPEPKFSEEIQYVREKGFSQDEIFAYYLYRQIGQYHRQNTETPIKEYLEPFIEDFKKASNWPGFDYSIDNLKKIGKKVWGKQGDISKHDDSRTDPVPWKSKKKKWKNVNAVGQQSSYFRDQYIVHRIEEIMKEKDRLLVVFGASHAVMQEPALRKIFENKK